MILGIDTTTRPQDGHPTTRLTRAFILTAGALMIGALAAGAIVINATGGGAGAGEPLPTATPTPTAAMQAPFTGDPRMRDPDYIVRFSFLEVQPLECPPSATHGCWYWRIETDHSCSAAEVEFGFAETPRGDIVFWDVLTVGELPARVPTDIVYPITSPDIPAQADLRRILCQEEIVRR